MLTALVIFGAAGSSTNPDGTLPVFDFTSTPWVSIIQLLLVFVIPLLVGLVTDRLTSKTLQVVLHGGLSFVTAFLTGLLNALITGGDYNWVNALANGLLTWILGIVIYSGIWKPSGVAAATQNSTAIQVFGPSSVTAVAPPAAPAQPTPPAK